MSFLITSEDAKKMLAGRSGKGISKEDLERIAQTKDELFVVEDGKVFRAAIQGREYFYKLVPTTGAPALEISGIRMHRTKGMTPDEDAAQKVRALGRLRGIVLDTCAGLGYTTTAALAAGAQRVVAIEKDENVVELAKINPWSAALFSESVALLHGDANDVINSFDGEYFDFIVHDPPRFSRAGELYGSEFYAQLHRVLKRGGRLYHYVGAPGAKYRGKALLKGVAQRLQALGFRVRLLSDAVVAEKVPQ